MRLASGEDVPADVIVTATGLVLQLLGGVTLTVDGQAVDPGERLSYKGVLFSGVPNLAAVFGYVNASWTLKADLVCAWVCRLLLEMDRWGARQVTPTPRDDEAVAPFVEGLTPGYLQRAIAQWLKQGRRAPTAQGCTLDLGG